MGEVKGVRAAGGAREFVLPCSRPGIRPVASKVSGTDKQKCWGKDKVADTPLTHPMNSC